MISKPCIPVALLFIFMLVRTAAEDGKKTFIGDCFDVVTVKAPGERHFYEMRFMERSGTSRFDGQEKTVVTIGIVSGPDEDLVKSVAAQVTLENKPSQIYGSSDGQLLKGSIMRTIIKHDVTKIAAAKRTSLRFFEFTYPIAPSVPGGLFRQALDLFVPEELLSFKHDVEMYTSRSSSLAAFAVLLKEYMQIVTAGAEEVHEAPVLVPNEPAIAQFHEQNLKRKG